MIELDHLEKVYLAREGSHRALHDVSLTIGEGEIFGIIGQSGAGKSCSSVPRRGAFSSMAST